MAHTWGRMAPRDLAFLALFSHHIISPRLRNIPLNVFRFEHCWTWGFVSLRFSDGQEFRIPACMV